ncbi:MAG: hypothetical protein AVDCRST_MAG37-1564 [uncultured Rubrobacteraceae bacterium]|uniref:DUF927 domain-containing protein n=1 Tax=uncultured Rubrobacteraceae bacterium TaxID=349277 RepID=A0A6J4QKG0_9ACTN|nr:MAG: hypothetical protein AVDCRST_MAG37-1564 [uncultured Rubrobacteraceae bacterium]
MTDTAMNFDYELRSDGVTYLLPHGENEIKAKLSGKSVRAVRVTLEKGNTKTLPETGNLASSSFRDKLAVMASGSFGEVNGLAEQLGRIADGYEDDLKERQEAADEHHDEHNYPEFAGTPYRIGDNGGFERIKHTQSGDTTVTLTNFVARIEEQVIKDDGQETRRDYRVKGQLGRSGKPLPTVDVAASRFNAMDWTDEAWGLAAHITAGPNHKAYASEAIQYLSQNANERRVYQHTGFRELPDGNLAYLHGAGAVGAEGVEVELEGRELARYALPTEGVDLKQVRRGVRTSLQFLRTAPARVTAPLFALAVLAPLSSMDPVDFTVWLWGRTGSLKSTLASLVLSLYGDFAEDELPLSFEATANFLERCLFLLKDVLAVVDDFRPPVSRADQSAMNHKAQRLLRGVGNRQGRGRMRADTTLRDANSPRGAVLVTAETLPEGPSFESATGRAFSVNVKREDVDLTAVTEVQHNKEALPYTTVGYLVHLQNRW